VALIVQISAAVMTAVGGACLEIVTGSDISPMTFALIEGAVACSASYLIGLDVWWLVIQLVFAPAALAMLRADLHPAIYLTGFLSLLGIYWTTFRTRVPLFLSDAAVWREVQAQLPESSRFAFVDIGSGLGGLLFHLDRSCARGDYEGIEIAPLPWLLGWLRAKCGGSSVLMRYGDYAGLDLASYDVVFAYLSPAAMPALWQKAKCEMRPGTLLMSCEFLIAGVPHDAAVELPGRRRRMLYSWTM